MNAVAQKRGAQLQSLYLGLLYPTEEHGVYGYITNTKIKLVVVTAGDIEPSDNAVKQFLHQFHKLYIDTMCNPFHVLGSPLTSQRYVAAPMPWRIRFPFRGVQSPCLCANFGQASSVHPVLVMQVRHQPRTPTERHAGLIRRTQTLNTLQRAALAVFHDSNTYSALHPWAFKRPLQLLQRIAISTGALVGGAAFLRRSNCERLCVRTLRQPCLKCPYPVGGL